MRKSSGEPKSIEAEIESSNNEEREREQEAEQQQTESLELPRAEEPFQDTAGSAETPQSDDWWSASPQAGDWGQQATSEQTDQVTPLKEGRTADVYFCGHTTFFPLNRALQAISREKLTGLLRSFWDQEPVDLLSRDGEIIFVSSKDPELYCPETPDFLAGVDEGSATNARDEQRKTGTPFFLALVRQELMSRESALDLMRQYGQKLFSQLWKAPRVWMMFEKDSDLVTNAGDLPGEPNVRDWALETLRLVENVDETAHFDPASIPAYTKDGFERVQKLKLTPDEAQFASQFNGNRSVQQIAKNLRLDLKSARQMLFRFVALEIVECWPASTAAKPEQQGIFQRFGRKARRDH